MTRLERRLLEYLLGPNKWVDVYNRTLWKIIERTVRNNEGTVQLDVGMSGQEIDVDIAVEDGNIELRYGDDRDQRGNSIYNETRYNYSPDLPCFIFGKG